MAALPYMQLYIADYGGQPVYLFYRRAWRSLLLLMFNYWQTRRPIPKTDYRKIASAE